MVSIDEAIALIKTQDIDLGKISIPVRESLDYCLAEQVIAPINLPSFDNSAMDGYAVCGVSETYSLIGEVAAGGTEKTTLNEGEAFRIFTGGKVPANTTAIIMQEKVKIDGKVIVVEDDVLAGKNIRHKGEEVKSGMTVFNIGHKISPATVGVLSSLGINKTIVFKKPNISIITTGNELIQTGEELKEGQIYESNGATIKVALSKYGFTKTSNYSVKDDFETIVASFKKELIQCDVLLISGGISVGEYDYVKEALLKNEVKEVFHKVKQKPGKPLFFGRKDNQFIFGLPGNPASALTCFYIYVLPLLQKLNGGEANGLTKLSLPIAHDYLMKTERPTFFKASITKGHINLLEGQGSSMLHSLAHGNALAFIGEKKQLSKGELIECFLL